MHPQPTEQQTRQIKARYLTAGMAVLRPLSATPLIASLVRREGDTVLVSFAGVAGEGSYYVEECVDIVEGAPVEEPTPVQRVPQNWYFTFGSGQQHDGKYVVIRGTHDAARDEMFRHFGNRWAFQYGTPERAGVDEFGLTELPRAEWPAAAHQQIAGWKGGPGECGVKCACDLTFDGFDTLAEAAELLERHIAHPHGEVASEEEAVQPEPDQHQRFAAMLTQLAADVLARRLPLGRSPSFSLGVLGSRADLEQWAAYFGSTIAVDTNGIPHIQSSTRLTGDRYGTRLDITAQAPQEQRSELERLRARVAELEAERTAGGAR